MFEIISRKGYRRIGKIETKHGVINTPFFMPDATRGFVKSLSKVDLEEIGVGPMVINTYHLYLEPGTELVKKSGGAHKFMNWERPLLSDSGGYQIFSLIHKNSKLGNITDKGAVFQSPVNGSRHLITPEKSIQIQFDLGVDMMVALDDVPPHSHEKEKIADAVERTIFWAERCMIEYKRQLKIRKIKRRNRPLFFCVIQGGMYFDLRKRCAEELVKIGLSAGDATPVDGQGPALDWDGYGFGARHIDQEGNFMEEMVRETAKLIPEKSLRFALGAGKPDDIVKFTNCGWDMFDCVIPTREGRHGRLFLRKKNFQSFNFAQDKLSIFPATPDLAKPDNFPQPALLAKNSLPVLFDGNRFDRARQSEAWQSKRGRQSISNDLISSGQKKKEGDDFYETMNITNEKFREDFSPVDHDCDCALCKNHTRAYLHHLFRSRDPLGARLAAIHNLKFYIDLMSALRKNT